MNKHLKKMLSPSPLTLLSIRKIRRTLKVDSYDELLKDEVFVHMIKYFHQCFGNPDLQAEASWIFTNIASGSPQNTALLVDNGVIQLSLNLMSSPSSEVVEQALWTIGNVVGDNAKYREMVIEMEGLDKILSFNVESMKVSFKRTYIWVLINFVRFTTQQLPPEVVKKIMPMIAKMLHVNDKTVIIDTLWALTYIAECGDMYIQLIIDQDYIISVTIELLSNRHFKIQSMAIRFLGNIATGTDIQAQELLDSDILEYFPILLNHNNGLIRRLSLWCLSNISIGTCEQALEVLNAGILEEIIQNLHRRDFRIKKEAILTVRNLISAASDEQRLQFMGSFISIYLLTSSRDALVASAARNAVANLYSVPEIRIKYATFMPLL